MKDSTGRPVYGMERTRAYAELYDLGRLADGFEDDIRTAWRGYRASRAARRAVDNWHGPYRGPWQHDLHNEDRALAHQRMISDRYFLRTLLNTRRYALEPRNAPGLRLVVTDRGGWHG